MNTKSTQGCSSPPHAPRDPARLSALVASLTLPLLLTACPDNGSSSQEPQEPQITVSTALPCVEPILPTFSSDVDESPTIGTVEVAVTGISAGDSNGLEVKLFYEDMRVVGCFLSSLNTEGGEVNYRCDTLESSALELSARRAYDSVYCLNRGKMNIYAEITLPDGTYKRSEPAEVLCIDAESFESSCTPVGVPEPEMNLDMGADMGLDMGSNDMSIPQGPTQWSIRYSSPDSPSALSVQGSVNEAPNVGRYQFKVVDQNDEPLSNVPVRFFLNWSALDDYPLCDLKCSELTDASDCDAREACVWDLSLRQQPPPSPEGGGDGAEGGAEGGAEQGGDSGGTSGGSSGGASGGGVMAPTVGACRVTDDWRGDERCEDLEDRCEANFCLSRDDVGPLPVAIDPLNALTNRSGVASVSLVAQREPGVFSVRAEATIDGRVQIANTPNITILHEIATQQSMSLQCIPSIINAFSTHDIPNDRTASTNGIKLYQFAEPISSCTLQLGDRFSGPISGSSVFFLSESGTITQSTLTDELGRATGQLINSAPAPTDVDPQRWAPPFVVPEGNPNVCQDAYSLSGSCDEIEEPERRLVWTEPLTGAPNQMTLNPRDGLTRVVAFTQGEASFIDILDPGLDTELNIVGLYQPDFDFVPLHSEPFVDANDNGAWDVGERFFDANRNGAWDLDVFGREELAESLRCAESSLKAISARTDASPSALPGCNSLVGTISTEDQLDTLIEALADDNPPNLNAYIWSSTQLLLVGLPIDVDTGVRPRCPEGALNCVRGQEYANDFVCGPLPAGAQLALDASSDSARFELAVELTDGHKNCLGLDAVYTISGEGLIESGVSSTDPLRESALPWGGFSPSYESCFVDFLTYVPYGQRFVSGALAPYVAPTDPTDQSEVPRWSAARLDLSVTVPDYRVSAEGTMSYQYQVNVAVCSY